MKTPNITFVDRDDIVIGHGTKTDALDNGYIHRIARVFIFDEAGNLLIQKRSPTVRLPNRWDVSVAGHVDQGETYIQAALRECKEEVGVTDLPLTLLGKVYTEENDEPQLKRRFNTLFRAVCAEPFEVATEEVAEVKWIALDELTLLMGQVPDDFTEGFQLSYQYYKDVSTSS